MTSTISLALAPVPPLVTDKNNARSATTIPNDSHSCSHFLIGQTLLELARCVPIPILHSAQHQSAAPRPANNPHINRAPVAQQWRKMHPLRPPNGTRGNCGSAPAKPTCKYARKQHRPSQSSRMSPTRACASLQMDAGMRARCGGFVRACVQTPPPPPPSQCDTSGETR